MSVAKVVEVSASSPYSFEEAIRRSIQKACKTVNDVNGAWVKEQRLTLENDDGTEHCVSMKLVFLHD